MATTHFASSPEPDGRSKDHYLPGRIVGLVVALSGAVVVAASNLA